MRVTRCPVRLSELLGLSEYPSVQISDSVLYEHVVDVVVETAPRGRTSLIGVGAVKRDQQEDERLFIYVRSNTRMYG